MSRRVNALFLFQTILGMKNLLKDVSRDDLIALSNFLQANGITENASVSPLLTGELSFTTESASSFVDNIRLTYPKYLYLRLSP